jgi:hypothetical protein
MLSSQNREFRGNAGRDDNNLPSRQGVHLDLADRSVGFFNLKPTENCPVGMLALRPITGNSWYTLVHWYKRD